MMSLESPGSGQVRGSGRPEELSASSASGLRLQILSTEHWSLLASRALAWNESFSRAGMFLATLSGATVALALAAQASNFGTTFEFFALSVLPVVLYVGIVTFLRLGESNYHDFQCIVGMNRIRSAYLEMAPELQPYFVMSPHDDLTGIAVTQGYQPGRRAAVHIVSATPAVVATLTAVVAGVIGAILGHMIGHAVGAAVGGLAVFAITFAGLNMYARRMARGVWAAHHPKFPQRGETGVGNPP
jgi:hypothetical protein